MSTACAWRSGFAPPPGPRRREAEAGWGPAYHRAAERGYNPPAPCHPEPRAAHPPHQPTLDLAYRRAAPADAPLLSVLATQVFLDTYATSGIDADLAQEATAVYAKQVFEQRLADDDIEIVLALAADRLVAFVDIAQATRCPVQDVTGAEVFRLYVQRPFLRRGIGRALLQVAERSARRRQHTGLWLTAWAGNTGAIAFYRALGFRDVGRTEYIIEGQGYENRVLYKPLARGGDTETPASP